MTQSKLSESELQLMQHALNADYKPVNIRLRKGEYQYSLAETIASFQLKLYFPNVKEIIAKLFGEERTSDVQFTRKIQTILKKMERSHVIKILPKKKPWELQRYMLLSFKFQDVDKNLISFATDDQINQAKEMLSKITGKSEIKLEKGKFSMKILISIFTLIISYGVFVWNLLSPIINPFILVIALSIAIISSVTLGRALA